jgi:preprotein translocase subunit SecA
MPLEEALGLAAEEGRQLVESKTGGTPVCTICDVGDYTVDEKSKQAFLTEEGHQRVEKLLLSKGLLEEGESLYDAGNIRLMHHLTAALRAHAIFRRDVEYIVKDGEIVIVDEFTGRTMPGRRWSDGLHQAIEAKEGVAVKEENQTVASITFQNYFRMYSNLSGMTGTADTEAFEFQQIYGLEVVVIPTHRAMVRKDHADLVYLTQQDKIAAIIEDITECRERGQPVLVGTTSIETSELLSGTLKKEDIRHQVLNAKQHEREAHVVADAGRPGAVTIATNMAGRGTDIVLGGNLEAELAALADDTSQEERDSLRKDWEQRHETVLNAGGLHIVGTERHESRRIDNQLRGRSGRQGDPGSSRFFLSMEDNLMRIFGDPNRTKAMLSRVGMREGEAIESRLLSRQIERAQRKVEAHNFDIRKALLEYDDVANEQRKFVYQQRNDLMDAEDVGDAITGIRHEVVADLVAGYVPPQSMEDQWDIAGLESALHGDFGVEIDIAAWLETDESIDEDRLHERIATDVDRLYEEKAATVGALAMRQIEKAVMLQQLDMHWKEHLGAMDYLRQGIHLRGYAQKNPKQEYKREAFEMFSALLDQWHHDVTGILCKARLRGQEDVEAVEEQRRSSSAMQFKHAAATSAIADPGDAPVVAKSPSKMRAARPGASEIDLDEGVTTFVRQDRKVGRNEPCPCGSGKKYKRCHGKLA